MTYKTHEIEVYIRVSLKINDATFESFAPNKNDSVREIWNAKMKGREAWEINWEAYQERYVYDD